MLEKTVSGIMLTVLLVSMLTFAFDVQIAKSDYVWTRTIYIRADGSIWPLGAPVSTLDNMTYMLTDSIVGAIPESSSVIVIERNNIVLDGGGYMLQGTKALVSEGIELNGRSNVTIKNMKITALHTGIALYNSSYCSISGNNITDNNWHGISLVSSCNNNSISGNNITNNREGINLDHSSNNSVSGNNLAANSVGVPFYYSFYNNLSGNLITNNGIGVALDNSSNNTVSRNNMTANSNEGVYLYSSCCDNSVSGNNMTDNGHGIRLDSSSNNSVSGNDMTNNGHCIWLYDSSCNNSVCGNNITNSYYGVYLNSSCCDNSVSGNNMTDNGHGVYLSFSSSNNNIIGNNIAADNEYGIYLGFSSCNNSVSGNNIANNEYGIGLNESSNNNSVCGNNITNNGDGVYLSGSSYSSIVENNMTNNGHGVRLYYSSNNNTISDNNIAANTHEGVYLWDSSNNSASRNNIANNEYGIWLYHSFHNSVSGNNMTDNGHGVYLYYSSDNRFYHNNMDNNQQVLIATLGYANVWDDGYPSGGNYWSDYTAVDLNGGPNQDTPGSDGIGDTPYFVEAGNQDRYPLMNRYVPIHLAITVTVGGTTDPLPGTYTYVKGTVASVTAIAGLNYRFEYWILNGTNLGTHNPIEVPMDSSHVLQAIFTQITHQLTITSTERGTTDPSSGTYTYVNGTEANVTATTEAGYSFDHWLLDGEVRTENPIGILMDMNHTLEAYFTDNLPPEIGEPIQEPSEDVEPFQNVTITVNVTDVGTGVCNVTLWYSIDNGTTWTPFNTTKISVNIYQTMIPGREDFTWVTYKIIAYDNSGNSATNDNTGYYYRYHVIPEFQLALILPLLISTTLVATLLLRRKRKTEPQFL